jgi:heme ABC exporter ATP-binding subunit CcmA
MASTPLISVSGLARAFGRQRVLTDVHLHVRAGEVVAVLGANGAGKTTLLRILATLVRPSAGTARVGGFDCVREAARVRRVVGFLAHGAWVYDDLTALENLRFWAMLNDLPVEADTLRGALAALELERVAEQRVRAFSLGMKRRLALARLSLGRPRVFLLDEPYAALDPRASKWLDGYLAAFKAGGGAVLLTTHSFGRGLAVADRVAILAGGRVAAEASAAGLSAEDLQRLYALHAEEGA